MPLAHQFSIFLDNRPGSLARVCKIMAISRVNIVALSVPETVGQGILRLVVDDPGRARSILKKEGLTFGDAEVLAVEMTNRPGAVADFAHDLAKADVNIQYVYGSAGTRGSNAIVIFHVDKAMRAQKIAQAKVY